MARHHSGGGWSRGGAAARVLASSSPSSSPLSIGPINPSAAACALRAEPPRLSSAKSQGEAQAEAMCRFCGFPVSRCYCPGRRTLADLANELDASCSDYERSVAEHDADPERSHFAARIADTMNRIEAQL
jgi:hypothetical protein